MDSFFPGIVLPADTWNVFINYTAKLKAEGNPQWVNFTCISDIMISQSRRCQLMNTNNKRMKSLSARTCICMHAIHRNASRKCFFEIFFNFKYTYKL